MREITFDPEHALGWRGNNPLHGLNCTLRCIEAVLFATGYSAEQVAKGLITPINLTGGLRDRFTDVYPACTVHWDGTLDRVKNWREISSLLESHIPVILRPDRYYWSGTPHYRSRHWADHMVLLLEIRGKEIELLNTEADPAHGYRETMAVTDEFINACFWYGWIEHSPDNWLELWNHSQKKLLSESKLNLHTDIRSLEQFQIEWREGGLPDETAKVLHTALLGDFQPSFFLFNYLASAFTPPLPTAVTGLLESLMTRSLVLAFCLLGENSKLGAGDHKVSLSALSTLIYQLKKLEEEFGHCTNFDDAERTNPGTLAPEFKHRLRELVTLFACPTTLLGERGKSYGG